MSATKVTLRKRELPSGKITLYLDFYPPIRNPRTMEMSRREYLGIYLAKNPKTLADRANNAEKMRQAEAIRAQRELSLINEQFGFIDKTKQKMDFLAYFKDKYILENINEHLDKIDTQDTRREFLTADEVQALYNTPCREPVLKAASLFSCLTGLRFSDILALKWENFETYPDGGHCIRLRTEKTEAEALNPISQEADQLCGEKSTGLGTLSSPCLYRAAAKFTPSAKCPPQKCFHYSNRYRFDRREKTPSGKRYQIKYQ